MVVFFDEINTNANIAGLFKEILIDKCLRGVPLDPRIIVIAACNPYKLKEGKNTDTQGLRLEDIGILSTNNKATQNLVYGVHPLPESMFNFIWNYAKLKERDEEEYVEKIIKQSRLRNSAFPIDDNLTDQIIRAVFAS